MKKSEFPAHLMVAVNENMDNGNSTARAEQQMPQTMETLWLASLSPEQQSILIHPHAIMARFPPLTALADFPRAPAQIQWEDISNGLRDIYTLNRLFKGFPGLLKDYVTDRDTVSPIGFITVSLNNAAVRQGSPCEYLSPCINQ